MTIFTHSLSDPHLIAHLKTPQLPARQCAPRAVIALAAAIAILLLYVFRHKHIDQPQASCITRFSVSSGTARACRGSSRATQGSSRLLLCHMQSSIRFLRGFLRRFLRCFLLSRLHRGLNSGSVLQLTLQSLQCLGNGILAGKIEVYMGLTFNSPQRNFIFLALQSQSWRRNIPFVWEKTSQAKTRQNEIGLSLDQPRNDPSGSSDRHPHR